MKKDVMDVISVEIKDNFVLSKEILAEAEKILNDDVFYSQLDVLCKEQRLQTLLLAYICAKQTKHHIVEESLLIGEKTKE